VYIGFLQYDRMLRVAFIFGLVYLFQFDISLCALVFFTCRYTSPKIKHVIINNNKMTMHLLEEKEEEEVMYT
jgi:hypothetical protein